MILKFESHVWDEYVAIQENSTTLGDIFNLTIQSIKDDTTLGRPRWDGSSWVRYLLDTYIIFYTKDNDLIHITDIREIS